MSVPILHILDVGHGNCAVLRDAGEVVAIDAGRGTTLREWLLEQGVEKLDTVLVSHSDQDHLQGLHGLLENERISIGRVRVNSDGTKNTRLWKDLIRLLQQQEELGKIDLQVGLTTGMNESFDTKSAGVEVLWPDKGAAMSGVGGKTKSGNKYDSNSLSAAVRVSVEGGESVLLPGDINRASFEQMSARPAGVASSVVVYPHHGGLSGVGDEAEFAKLISKTTGASMFVFSNSAGNQKTPRPEIIDALRASGSNIWIACTQLSPKCVSVDPNGQASTGSSSPKNNGSRRCAGPLRIPLAGDTGEWDKKRLEHQEFITLEVTAALCRTPTP